jgi:hypothetical protein
VFAWFGGRPANGAAPVAASINIPEQIRALAPLRAQGIVSGDEFQSKKANLLSRV